MRLGPACAILALFAAQTAAAGEQHRQLGAHEHGRGTLNIAVEGDKLTIELEAPAMDIVGFEHPATSGRDIEAIDHAKAQLQNPLTLFELAAAAGCHVTDASVTVEFGAHDHDARDSRTAPERGAEAGHEPSKSAVEAEAKSDGHSEFHAQYNLACATVSNVTAIEFAYFRAFAGAEKLDVNVITPKGQSKFEATRTKPTVSLIGMM